MLASARSATTSVSSGMPAIEIDVSSRRTSPAIAFATVTAPWTAAGVAWVTAASMPASTGRRIGSLANTSPAATARQSAPSPNEPVPASNHGSPDFRRSTVAAVAGPVTRNPRMRWTRRSLTSGAAPTPACEHRLRRDHELLHAGADFRRVAGEGLAGKLPSVDRLRGTATALLLLTEAAQGAADRRAEQRACGPGRGAHARRQDFGDRVARVGQEPAGLEAHHGDRAQGPSSSANTSSVMAALAFLWRGILSKRL